MPAADKGLHSCASLDKDMPFHRITTAEWIRSAAMAKFKSSSLSRLNSALPFSTEVYFQVYVPTEPAFKTAVAVLLWY